MHIFKIISIFLTGFILISCKDSTVNLLTPEQSYKEILSVSISNVKMELYITGYDSLTTGYNDIYFKVKKDSVEQNRGYVKFYPKMWMTPHLWHGTPVDTAYYYDNSTRFYKGSAIFNMQTSPPGLIWYSRITYHDENGFDFVSDSIPTFTSYHPEKQWKSFYDSTGHLTYYLSLVKPFSANKGLNDFWVVIHKADGNEQNFVKLTDAQNFISVYKSDSLNHSSGNVSPVIWNDGIYRGKINLPYKGIWKMCDTIFYNNHYITNNPPPLPEFTFEVN